jgi:hypothetical protein
MNKIKKIISFLMVMFTTAACATSGTTIGNGLIQKPIESKKEGDARELCLKNKGAKVIKQKDSKGQEVEVCDLGQSKIKTFDELLKETK